MKEDKNLPALDDDSWRKLNTKKVMGTIEGIGDYVQEARKSAKIGKYYIIFILVLLVFLFIGAIIMVAIKSGGFDNFIDNMFNTDHVNRRILCFHDDKNMTFRTPYLAYYFQQTFNGSKCEIINIL